MIPKTKTWSKAGPSSGAASNLGAIFGLSILPQQRPTTGKAVDTQILYQSEPLLNAKKFYEHRYGSLMENLPAEFLQHPNYLKVTSRLTLDHAHTNGGRPTAIGHTRSTG